TEDYETALVNITGPDVGLTLFQLLRERVGARLNAFEIVPVLGLELQLRHGFLDRDPTAGPSPWYALIEVSRMKGGPEGTLQAAIEAAFADGLIDNAVMAESLEDRTRMWAFREQMSEVQSKEGA